MKPLALHCAKRSNECDDTDLGCKCCCVGCVARHVLHDSRAKRVIPNAALRMGASEAERATHDAEYERLRTASAPTSLRSGIEKVIADHEATGETLVGIGHLEDLLTRCSASASHKTSEGLGGPSGISGAALHLPGWLTEANEEIAKLRAQLATGSAPRDTVVHAARAVYRAWDEDRSHVNKMFTLGRALKALELEASPCARPTKTSGSGKESPQSDAAMGLDDHALAGMLEYIAPLVLVTDEDVERNVREAMNRARGLRERAERGSASDLTLTHDEAQRIREIIMGDEHGGNRAACRAAYEKLGAFVLAKWDAEESEAS